MTQRFVGLLILRDDRIFAGWIFDTGHVGAACTVTLRIGEWRSPPSVANKPRKNLADLGEGRSDHGLAIRVPQDVPLVPGTDVELLVEGVAEPVISGMVPDRPEVVGRVGSLPKAISAIAKARRSGPRAPWTDVLTDPFAALDVISTGGHPLRSSIKDLDDLSDFGVAVLKRKRLFKLLRDAGRARSRARRYDDALRLLQAARALEPDDPETTFHFAVAASRGDRHDVALEAFRAVRATGWEPGRHLSEHGQALRRKLTSLRHARDAALEAELVDVSRAWLDLDDGRKMRYLPAVATMLARIGEFDLAERVFHAIIRAHPDRLDVNVERMRFLLETKRVDEGLALARRIVDRWPDAEPAHHILRTYRFLDGMRREAEVVGHARRASDGSGWVVAIDAAEVPLERALETRHPDWIVFADGAEVDGVRAQLVNAAAVGCMPLPSGGRAWRCEVLRDLQDSDLLDAETVQEDLDRAAPFYVRPRPREAGGATALVVSLYGGVKFGGAEHFLWAASEHYAKSGYDRVLVVGSRDKRPSDFTAPTHPAIECEFVDLNATTLRRLVVERNVSLVHAVSGLGYVAAGALGSMNVPFIYGVHYFREVFGGEGSEIYFDGEGATIPRPEFAFLLARASSVYVNSTFTRDLMERAHGVRCPVIYSVPDEVEA